MDSHLATGQRQPFGARTSTEVFSLVSAVATAILAVIIVSMLYFGRDIFVPVALAILLSFVLGPLVGLLERVRVPRGLAVVSLVIIAFSLIFAMGSSSHSTDAACRGSAQLSNDNQRQDLVVSRYEGRQGYAGTSVRYAQGPQ